MRVLGEVGGVWIRKGFCFVVRMFEKGLGYWLVFGGEEFGLGFY